MKVAAAIAAIAAVTVIYVLAAAVVGKMLRSAGERDEQRAEDTRRLIDELRRGRR